jgi:hypothetical protein
MRSILSEVESWLDTEKVMDTVYANCLLNNQNLIVLAADGLNTAGLSARFLPSQKTQV